MAPVQEAKNDNLGIFFFYFIMELYVECTR